MFDQKEFLEKIKEKVLQHDTQASVILFGSRARGDHKPDSDWDFLILTNKKADFKFQSKMRNAIYNLELKYDQDISTIIMESSQWEDREITSFHKNVTAEGLQI